MSNGSGTYYILTLSFPSTSNPACGLSLKLDTAFQGASFSTAVNGDNYENIGANSVEIGLPAGTQSLSSHLAMDVVASITGILAVDWPLACDVTLGVMGTSIVTTLSSGSFSQPFAFTFPTEARAFTYAEVIEIFNGFLAAA